MHRRLLIIGILALVEVLWLLVGAVSATESPDYEAYVAAQGQTIASIAQEYGISPEFLAQVNQLDINASLKAGQVVILPAVEQTEEMPNTPMGQAREAEAETPAGNTVQGVLGVVSAKTTQILAQPGPGKVLFQSAPRGTELLVLGETSEHYGILMADGGTGFVLKKAATLSQRFLTVTRPAPPPPPLKPDSPLIDTAYEYMGIPYKYGGRLPANVDCSLLIQTVFRRHGIRLPRTAAQQFEVGETVEVQELQAGDRLYFYNRARTKIGHTALYIGDGDFIHASSNRGMVAVDSLRNSTYWSIYAGARR